MDKKKKISIWYIVKYVFLFGMLLFALVPLLQVFINSFRSDREVKTMPLGLPKQWVFNNYRHGRSAVTDRHILTAY